MILYNIFLVVSAYVSFSSILLNKTDHPILLVILGLFFVFSIFLEKRYSRLQWLQVALLALFHWASQLNWVSMLYYGLLVKGLVHKGDLRSSVLHSFLNFSVYTAIRFSYSPLNIKTFLLTGIDLLSFMLAGWVGHSILRVNRKKNGLQEENERLVTHDPLTNLVNFQEYHRRLNLLLEEAERFAVIHLDCTDFKSMNMEHGYQEGNRILKKIAETLKHMFPEADIIARYGGDEFAVAIRMEKEEFSIPYLASLLESKIPEWLGIQVTYGYAIYPDEGKTMDDLIRVVEERLYEMKRERWLKREEKMLRSEKLRIVGELAAGMAHEIRNPLTAIKGFLQISKEYRYNIEPWYELIMMEIARMNQLTAEFLQFSKQNEKRFKVAPLQDCIQKVIQLMEPVAILLGHQIIVRMDPVPLYVQMDKDKIVQVLINLVQNAFDAMDKGGTVAVRLTQKEDHGMIEVEDTGVGMDKDQLEQIFLPFYTTKENGTGLGLSICYKIIDDHGGKIEVESVRNKGTVFRILLPLVKVKAAVM